MNEPLPVENLRMLAEAFADATLKFEDPCGRKRFINNLSILLEYLESQAPCAPGRLPS